ncbi:futalosine synthase, putative [Syntrophotalea carbinolica DSM 2380]|uniref:Chorismate dehydratase n=1 Tax=Syntrophotalea carbinolica (strain DSM 2380 / NBRC 103641 / GraBd1) TaxID=338963 RepID=Q3A2P3_SYNC1|nr:menaquinone biosynthesis protein [Syntrophotalea carbinolica]ABA89364.1 futalosine synthase, putative [Syntrophotalea carbinolica DSM 2380]
MSLRVGHIAYANCVPFFHYLSECGFEGDIYHGVPSELNSLLAEGRIDLSPSSSFEYGKNWRRYSLLPGVSISSCGPVQSVLLFTSRPLHTLNDVPVALTGESATSINLLRLLCLEFYGYRLCERHDAESTVEEIIATGGSGLLIGDRALKAAQQTTAAYVYDLGELWWRHTGLPFVFALWIVHHDAVLLKRQALARFNHQLQASLQRALSDLERLARCSQEASWMGVDKLAAYWRTMSYTFTDQHRQGLEMYFRLAVKHQLLKEIPRLDFMEWVF